MTIIIQQDATEYSLFKSVNCLTCFGWYFTHHHELITLYLQYLALMRPAQLPVVNVNTVYLNLSTAQHVLGGISPIIMSS